MEIVKDRAVARAVPIVQVNDPGAKGDPRGRHRQRGQAPDGDAHGARAHTGGSGGCDREGDIEVEREVRTPRSAAEWNELAVFLCLAMSSKSLVTC